jgi:hypothetical protein
VADVELGQAGGLAYRAAGWADRFPFAETSGRYWPLIAERLPAASSPR